MIVFLDFMIEIFSYIAEQKAHIMAYWSHCEKKQTNTFKNHSEQYFYT